MKGNRIFSLTIALISVCTFGCAHDAKVRQMALQLRANVIEDEKLVDEHIAKQTQFYSMGGTRAIWHQGWKASAVSPAAPDAWAAYSSQRWELYDTENDPCECHDLADQQPEKLQEMIGLWWAEAGRYECTIALDSYYLAAGEYCFDLIATHTNVSVDHRVDSAVRFVVDNCSPDNIPYNLRQSQGFGNQAMRLAAPIQFTPLPAIEDAPVLSSD